MMSRVKQELPHGEGRIPDFLFPCALGAAGRFRRKAGRRGRGVSPLALKAFSLDDSASPTLRRTALIPPACLRDKICSEITALAKKSFPIFNAAAFERRALRTLPVSDDARCTRQAFS